MDHAVIKESMLEWCDTAWCEAHDAVLFIEECLRDRLVPVIAAIVTSPSLDSLS